MPGGRLVAHPLPGALELIRTADPRPHRDPALGRPVERRHVEVRVDHLAQRPGDGRCGHQQDVRRTARRLCLERTALLHAEPVLFVHHRQGEIGERELVLEQRVRADHDPRLPRRDRLERVAASLAAERPGEQRDRQRHVLEQGAERDVVLACKQVGRREQGRLASRERGGRKRPRRHGRLAGPHVALDQAQHRYGSGEVRPELVQRHGLVRRQLDGPAQLARQRCRHRVPDPRVRGGIDGQRQGVRATSGTAPGDHAQLEGQQLVEGETAKGRIARFERCRVVSGLDRIGDGRDHLLPACRLRQVLRVRVPGAIERLAHRLAQPRCRQPGGEPVDGDDASHVQQRFGIRALELRRVEHDREASTLEAARDEELVARPDPALDEPAAEPGRLRGPGVIREERRGDLDPPAPCLLHLDVRHPDARRDDRAVRHGVEVAQVLELAQVVVPPREVEQQVANGVETETPARAAERGRRRQARHSQRQVEPLRGVGGDRHRGLRPQGSRTALRGWSRAPGAVHSAEIRYR